jgi:hypothetical protein
MNEVEDIKEWTGDRREPELHSLGDPLRRFAFALRAFLQGFVGKTALPRESRAACDALTHGAKGRGRCC